MKYVAILFIVGFASFAQAQDTCGIVSQKFVIKFKGSHTEEAPVTNYKVFHGLASGQYEEPIDIGNPPADPDGVSLAPLEGTYPTTKDHYFAMSAVGPGGESNKSNEIKIATSFIPCPPAPPTLKEVAKQTVISMRSNADKLSKIEKSLRLNADKLESALNSDVADTNKVKDLVVEVEF